MSKVSVPNCGAAGVIKDLSAHELPISAWTDAQNIRFLDGYAYQFLGHGEVYNSPAFAPQYVMPVNVVGARYWLYATATKQFVVTNTAGVTTHTDISHIAPRAGVVNQWSGFVFGGIPVLNTGDTSTIPMYWDQNLAHKFVDLPAWPANTYCKALRSFKNFIFALNVTKPIGKFPFMVKFSSPADPGSLPVTWNEADATQDAGEFDLSDGQDPIIDGLALKDSFIVYKEASTYRLVYVGGTFVFQSSKVFGMSGLLNIGCAVEFDSFHFAVTGSDLVIHDGYTATSVLDKRARRFFFQDIDVAQKGKVFCFKNPFLNEIFVAYPSIGALSCNKALVYNFLDKTVSFRSLPNLNHAAYGPIDNTLGGNWSQDNDSWNSDLTAWNGPDFTPDTTRVMMGSADVKLYLLDASASFNGALPAAYLERRGLSLDQPESFKTVTGVRPRIYGNLGDTVVVKLGGSMTPYGDPEYQTSNFTIGVDRQVDLIVSWPYLAIRFETGTAAQWRLDSYDLLDVVAAGLY